MPSDDKLDMLKEMIALVGEAVLQGDQRAQLHALCARYEEVASKPKPAAKRSKAPKAIEPLPDVHAEFNARTREEFVRWASVLEIATLKRIVKVEQFDPVGRAAKWRKPEKFAELIHEQLEVRVERGGGFGRAAHGGERGG